MNEENGIIVRNQPNKSRAYLSSTQQPAYNFTNDNDQLNNSNNMEMIKRKRQAEYAEELRQQILQKKSLDDQKYNTQRRAFMSNLSGLYGDQSAEIERKKKQQEIFAESLRKQIEEKRRAREIEKQKEAAREATYYSISNTNEKLFTQVSPTSDQNYANPVSVNENTTNLNNFNNTNNRLLNQARQAHFQTQPISRNPYKSISQKQPKTINEIEIKNNFNFSETVPLVALPHLTFEIPTESPFAHSTVKTPPLGFSLRRDHPTSLSVTAPIRQINPPSIEMKNNLSKSALAQHPATLKPSQQNRILKNEYVNKSNANNSTDKYNQVSLDVIHSDAPVRLGTASELVYPDGHISPITSPR